MKFNSLIMEVHPVNSIGKDATPLSLSHLTFVVNQLCQHMHDPNHAHFQQLKQVLRYVNGTLDLGLQLHTRSLEITTYSDSDWASDKNDCKLTSGYFSLLSDIPVS